MRCARSSGASLYYTRYLDDQLSIFRNTPAALDFWREYAELDPVNIRITGIPAATSNVPFLDLSLTLADGRVHISVFQKALNTYQYLTPSSFHTITARKAFVRGELLRYAIRSTHEKDFIRTTALLADRLLERKYKPEFLRPIFETVRHSDRSRYLLPRAVRIAKQAKPRSEFYRVVPWDPLSQLVDFKGILLKHWPVLSTLLPSGSSIGLSYSKGQSLGDLFAGATKKRLLTSCEARGS